MTSLITFGIRNGIDSLICTYGELFLCFHDGGDELYSAAISEQAIRHGRPPNDMVDHPTTCVTPLATVTCYFFV
ncbi:hypothetical protein F2Q70_00011560 [Brassica cretica]|uniref:Uncharacterized protein n=1 Tax=Brassica cretica TaxID=69181 RepID=A0A8S9LWG6_BRACR|nr:hypothetical protein F2Q70_00011560 [Brassica cretica]